MRKVWFSLLVALLKDRNLGHLAAHHVMRQPGMSIINDLEVHVLPLLLSCTLTKHQTCISRECVQGVTQYVVQGQDHCMQRCMAHGVIQ